MVSLAPGEQCPEDAGVLVGDSHGGDMLSPALAQAVDPITAGVAFLSRPLHRGPRPVNKQRSQIAIAPLRDTQQARFPPAGVLLGHQTQPRHHLPAVVEDAGITHGGEKGRGNERANPLHLSQTLTTLILLEDLFDAPVVLRNLFVQGAQTLIQLMNQLAT